MKLFWPTIGQFEDALKSVQDEPLNKPFSNELVSFVQALSKRLVKLRHLPEVVALGYWMRKANVYDLQLQFEASKKGKMVRPRGIIFHIAPSNVDTIFVYSWILSLLAGNKNVIRLSSKVVLNELLQVILEEISKNDIVGKSTIICTYSHEEQATSLLSKACHTRVIWGGDETIQTVRQIPLAPLANELTFADRFSLAVLNSEKVEKLDGNELDLLLEKFYNDVFWFDQMACSSPRLVIWKGHSVPDFWKKLEEKIKQKQYELLAATQVLKYTTTLHLATYSNVKNVSPTTYISKIQMHDIDPHVREMHCGGGLFYEYEVDHLTEVAQIISDKDQTLAYYGFDKSELNDLVNSIQSRGLDRIVPVGQALDFKGVWDGQNFLTSFTREVLIL